MDGSLTPPLHFPVATPPGPGETLRIAPGVEWLRMPLPFALDHINLWLLADGPGWTIVDAGYAMAETTARGERIFAERLGGLPVTRIIITHHHPDHIGLAGWLAERWQAPLWTSEKEWLFARLMTGSADDSRGLRRDFARRAGFDEAASELFAEHHQGYRRGVPSVPSSFRRLADGLVVEIGGQEWRVIIGEGHSPELACLYCAETGVLISGDQVLPKISPNVSVQAHEPDSDPLSRFFALARHVALRSCARDARPAVAQPPFFRPTHADRRSRGTSQGPLRRDYCSLRTPPKCYESAARIVSAIPRPASDGIRAGRGARPFALPDGSRRANPWARQRRG